MATKSTLESANVALKTRNDALETQLAKLAEQVAALTQAQAAAPAKPKPKPEKPLVSRGYFKQLDSVTGKWVDDLSRPCVIIAIPGAKPRKTSEENFQKELSMHAQIAAAYKALPANGR